LFADLIKQVLGPNSSRELRETFHKGAAKKRPLKEGRRRACNVGTACRERVGSGASETTT